MCSSQADLQITALRRRCRPPWSHPEALSYQCERDTSVKGGGGAPQEIAMGTLMGPFQCAHMVVCGSEEMIALSQSQPSGRVMGLTAGTVGRPGALGI